MGSGASTELTAAQKSAIVSEARSVYLQSSEGEQSDIELFTTVSDAVTTKVSQYVTGTSTTSAITAENCAATSTTDSTGPNGADLNSTTEEGGEHKQSVRKRS